MNVNYRIGGRKARVGTLGTVGGVLSVLVGSLVAVAGLLVVWISLVLGAVAFFGWWGWQRLRGRQPALDLAGMLARQAAARTQQARSQAAGGHRIPEGDVVDVEVREVEPAHPGSARRPGDGSL